MLAQMIEGKERAGYAMLVQAKEMGNVKLNTCSMTLALVCRRKRSSSRASTMWFSVREFVSKRRKGNHASSVENRHRRDCRTEDCH